MGPSSRSFPYLLRAAGALTGLPITVLVPALNGLAALLALIVLYLATRRFASKGVATAVVALVATSMAMPVWTLAYSDTMGLASSPLSHSWPLDAMDGSP